ncbi:hypothetical protein P691DRAFT_768228 [Macrolepiota fuliginosa MF-IS2]|uniref:Uncharacterized protein n=1 Tax=Macrolepiota fuliginosa MF-IS2 TaxID=1400762 RepID=A0A9P5WWJ8_9AGAR|nr:hypothetical protein P691DRAFT_768228 [Macrolepiota fuliginosa MF-IS2]
MDEDKFNQELDFDAHDILVRHICKAAKQLNIVNLLIPPTPSPPTPYSQLHSNEEDICMEPPTPTHVFSEAAMQTPAPSPVMTSPSPPTPSTPAAEQPPAAVTSSKSGPKLRPSYAGAAAAKPLCPTAPPFVHAPIHTPQPPPQFYIEMKISSGISLPDPANKANTTLLCVKSPLHINSTHFTSSGITCTTASVLTQSDLDIIEATLPTKLAGSCITLPTSQSFIKIVDIPYFKPGTTKPPNRQEIGNQKIPSPILVNMIEHAQFVCNSPKADSSTFWINLMDSQQGTLASSLIRCWCFLNGIDCLIQSAKAHTSSPQCQQCWKSPFQGFTPIYEQLLQRQPQVHSTPFPPLLQTWLAPMFTPVSTAVLNTLQTTGTVHTGTTNSTATGSSHSLPRTPLPRRLPPLSLLALPPALPCLVSCQPHSNAACANSVPATIQPPQPQTPLPPTLSLIVEDGGDNDMNFGFSDDEEDEAAGPQPGNYGALLIVHGL